MKKAIAPSAFRPTSLPDGYHGWIPAVGTYPGCGALTPYMYGAALAHSQVFDFVLLHGRSGGAIAAAMLAAKAPIDKVEEICNAWNPRESLHQADTQSWRKYVDIQGRGNADALENFLDAQFASFNHRTWGDFRYEERPPGIDVDHRLQIGLCYIDIPEKQVERYERDRPTFLRTVIHARSLAIKSMVFPRDAHLLPHLAGKIDDLPLAPWLVHTSRNVSQFEGEPMPREPGGKRVLLDGATRAPEPHFFPAGERPPYPEVTFRYDMAKDRVRQVAEDLRAFPWTLRTRADAPCASFDIEKIEQIKHELVQRGYADCAAAMQETVLPYLECMTTEGKFRTRPVPTPRSFSIPVRSPLVAARQRLVAVTEHAQARAGEMGHAVSAAPVRGLRALRSRAIANAPAESDLSTTDTFAGRGFDEPVAGLG